MQKARRLLWLLLALAGLLLIATFMTSGIGEIPGWVSPTAQAADKYDGGSACTNKGQGPSFGGTVVIGPGEVLCGDLTSFGGTVEIEGEIRGNVTRERNRFWRQRDHRWRCQWRYPAVWR